MDIFDSLLMLGFRLYREYVTPISLQEKYSTYIIFYNSTQK